MLAESRPPTECYLSQQDAWNGIRKAILTFRTRAKQRDGEDGFVCTAPSERKAEKLGDDVSRSVNPAPCDSQSVCSVANSISPHQPFFAG